MLISAFRYSYINSKLHSLKSMLLQQLDYKNLIQAQGFNGFVEYLKPTSYGKNLDESIHSYDELTCIYHRNFLNDYTKLMDTISTVSIDRLLDAKDLFDFINRLKDTWYYDPLDNSAYRFEKEGETFPLEIALDLRYYGRLFEWNSL